MAARGALTSCEIAASNAFCSRSDSSRNRSRRIRCSRIPCSIANADCPMKPARSSRLGARERTARGYQAEHADHLATYRKRKIVGQRIRDDRSFSSRFLGMFPTPGSGFQFPGSRHKIRSLMPHRERAIRWQKNHRSAMEIDLKVMSDNLQNLFEIARQCQRAAECSQCRQVAPRSSRF